LSNGRGASLNLLGDPRAHTLTFAVGNRYIDEYIPIVSERIESLRIMQNSGSSAAEFLKHNNLFLISSNFVTGQIDNSWFINFEDCR
jgi:hypothetical protein